MRKSTSASTATEGDPALLQADDMTPARPADGAADPETSADGTEETSTQLEVASPPEDADDDVHFGVAAKALGVSRKTVERMVKRGRLERGPSGTPATVSKRALVAILEKRRQEAARQTQVTDSGNADQGSGGLTSASPDAADEWEQLASPLLRPLLDELTAARTRAALLERELDHVLMTQSAEERDQDALLRTLATGGWRERRKARKEAIRRYVTRDADVAE